MTFLWTSSWWWIARVVATIRVRSRWMDEPWVGSKWPSYAGTSSTGEKLHFPGEGDSTGATVLGKDACQGVGCLFARPITLPFSRHGNPSDRHRTSGGQA